VSVSSGADLRLSSPRRLLRLDYYAYYTAGMIRYRWSNGPGAVEVIAKSIRLQLHTDTGCA